MSFVGGCEQLGAGRRSSSNEQECCHDVDDGGGVGTTLLGGGGISMLISCNSGHVLITIVRPSDSHCITRHLHGANNRYTRASATFYPGELGNPNEM